MLQLLTYPNRVLKKAASKVTRNLDLDTLIENMFDTMYAAKGIGLAAPQVGVSKRVAVIHLNEPDSERLVMINPVIVKRKGTVIEEEGCLSVPGITAEVKRSVQVEVSFYDENGEEKTLVAEGVLARAIQHEVDHLNGVLFVDRLSPSKRHLLSGQLKELQDGVVPTGEQRSQA